MKITRRRFIAGSLAATAGLLTGTTAFFSIQDESNAPVVDEVTLPIKGLAPGLEGFTIAQMADFHLYPYTRLDLITKSVAIANALNPDVTVLVGDFVWRNLEAIFDLAPVLGRLNARHGVFAVLGNHDLWLDAGVVASTLERSGVPVLVNHGVSLAQGGGQLYLAGLDDGWSGHPDLDAAMAGAPAEAPVVLLLHEPDLADVYSQDPRVALQLAGHTHGGQIRINGRALIHPYLGKKYDLGLYDVNGMWLYTNRGIGVISEPFRYNCPPEITLFTLTAA